MAVTRGVTLRWKQSDVERANVMSMTDEGFHSGHTVCVCVPYVKYACQVMS